MTPDDPRYRIARIAQLIAEADGHVPYTHAEEPPERGEHVDEPAGYAGDYEAAREAWRTA